MTTLHNFEKIKSIVFESTLSTVTCYIHLEDGCAVVHKHNKGLTTEEYSESKEAAYKGAFVLFNRLCGIDTDAITTTEKEPFTGICDMIYNYIEMNEFTTGLLMAHIKSLAVSMHITGALTRLSPMFIPRLMAGRQTGHTTAIKRFIENNPNLKIGIITKSEQFEFTSEYHKYRNAFNIVSGPKNRGYTDNSIRGIKLDYIIFDGIGVNGLDISALERVLCTSSVSNNTRIIGLGN